MHTKSDNEDLFYEGLIAAYVDNSEYVSRDWLFGTVKSRLAKPECRYVLLVGEPGAGKTGVVASLAKTQPDWLRYFIRSDSVTPLSGVDSASMLLRIGYQLAQQRPMLFNPELLEIVVEQRVGQVAAEGRVTGVRIEDLNASPFYRTAIRVQQNVQSLAGGLTAVEVARANLEPRLLNPDTLSYMALLDPAAVLARKHPNEMIVVLVDALDEIFSAGGSTTILDWLESGPELPANIRFVLSSRPHARLRTLESVRSSAIEIIMIEEGSEEVEMDVQRFAKKLFEDTGVLQGRSEAIRNAALVSLRIAARGNFAYLSAYSRSLRAALAAKDTVTLAELLTFEALPTGLYPLYTSFIRRIRSQIEQMGRMEIAYPDGVGNEFIPAWEGIGERLLAVLSVAYAPLSLEQLIALGSIRVWKSAVTRVLERFSPFLDETSVGWRFFHLSMSEFLKNVDQPNLSDIRVDGYEWNARIVRHYRGNTSWDNVDWQAMDNYGLVYLVEHLLASCDDPEQAIPLVNLGLRRASRHKFLTNLPFHRIVERIRESLRSKANKEGSGGVSFPETVFLELVLAGLRSNAARLDPAVHGLMARLGRVQEALNRAGVLMPGMHKYRSLEAIIASTPAELRAELGPLDGVEHLVEAALEVPASDTRMVGFMGMDRRDCLRSASQAMAVHDTERALHLAELAEDGQEEPGKNRDSVLAKAASVAIPNEALALVSRMGSGRARAAIEAANRADPGSAREQLITVAVEYLNKEVPAERLQALAELLVLKTNSSPSDRQTYPDLVAEIKRLMATGDDSWEWSVSVIRSAGILHQADPALAEQLLRSYDQSDVDSASSWQSLTVAEIMATWGKEEECRRLLEKALTYFRNLKWFGPAKDIARVAHIASRIDKDWAKRLADEAIALVEPEIAAKDMRLGGVLAGMVREFRTWDRTRSMRVADWITGSWVHGSSWDSEDGTGSAKALLGLDAADDDPELAAQLLAACLTEEEAGIRFGRIKPDVIDSRLFPLSSPAESRDAGLMNMTSHITYIQNSLSYWSSGRDWRFFTGPAELLRSIHSVFPAGASLASAFATAVIPVGDMGLERAIEMVTWLCAPQERLVALAALANVMEKTGDQRLQQVLTLISTTARQLPRHQATIDLDKIPQGPILQYINPSVRALFEAAILLPDSATSQSGQLIGATGTWYAECIWRAELLSRYLTIQGHNIPKENLIKEIGDLVEQLSQADELIGSIVRPYFVQTLAVHSMDLARIEIGKISHPALKTMASLLILPYVKPAGKLVQACLEVLGDLSQDVNPLHRAGLAAVAIQICEAEHPDTEKLLQWGLSGLANADPLFEVRGLITLTSVAPFSDQAGLLARALGQLDGIGNEYLRNDAMADLLGPVLASATPAMEMEIIQRIIQSGWAIFVEGLRRAMPELVERAGTEVVERLDTAIRQAQRVVGPSTSTSEPEHLDGVFAAHLRTSALLPSQDAYATYMSLYLDRNDLPASMRCIQDTRLNGSDPDDDAFHELGGQYAGLAVWMNETDQCIWRLVDIRFQFDTSAHATAYFLARLQHNSEGMPEIINATLVGEECSVFGGTNILQLGNDRIEKRVFFYIFRVKNVVTKLFVAQGPATREPLTPDHLLPIASAIVERIWRVTGTTDVAIH